MGDSNLLIFLLLVWLWVDVDTHHLELDFSGLGGNLALTPDALAAEHMHLANLEDGLVIEDYQSGATFLLTADAVPTSGSKFLHPFLGPAFGLGEDDNMGVVLLDEVLQELELDSIMAAAASDIGVEYAETFGEVAVTDSIPLSSMSTGQHSLFDFQHLTFL